MIRLSVKGEIPLDMKQSEGKQSQACLGSTRFWEINNLVSICNLRWGIKLKGIEKIFTNILYLLISLNQPVTI